MLLGCVCDAWCVWVKDNQLNESHTAEARQRTFGEKLPPLVLKPPIGLVLTHTANHNLPWETSLSTARFAFQGSFVSCVVLFSSRARDSKERRRRQYFCRRCMFSAILVLEDGIASANESAAVHRSHAPNNACVSASASLQWRRRVGRPNLKRAAGKPRCHLCESLSRQAQVCKWWAQSLPSDSSLGRACASGDGQGPPRPSGGPARRRPTRRKQLHFWPALCAPPLDTFFFLCGSMRFAGEKDAKPAAPAASGAAAPALVCAQCGRRRWPDAQHVAQLHSTGRRAQEGGHCWQECTAFVRQGYYVCWLTD